MASPETMRRIESLERLIEEDQQKINQIEDKIDRLEKAKSSVKSSYEDIASFVSWIGNYDVGRAWLGQKREEFETGKTGTKSAGDTFRLGVNDTYQLIVEKQSSLRSEIGDCQSAINDKQWQITQLYWFGG